jgi:hypothetical protein
MREPWVRYHETRARFAGTCTGCRKSIWVGDIIYRFPSEGAYCQTCGAAKCNLRRIWAPQFIVSLMLLWALNPTNPYSYYILLRWVCCPTFAFLSAHALDAGKQGWGWALGITALLYNPIIQVGLTREIWSIVNVVTIMLAVTSIFVLKVNDQRPPAA